MGCERRSAVLIRVWCNAGRDARREDSARTRGEERVAGALKAVAVDFEAYECLCLRVPLEGRACNVF